jgi:3-hydroxyacyl-CoA dehydrogenase
LEIIPTPKTDPAEVIDFLMKYGELYLGKTTVIVQRYTCIYCESYWCIRHHVVYSPCRKNGITVDEVDKLTGPVLGRPKSATFRTCDVVGLDTLVHVANGLS